MPSRGTILTIIVVGIVMLSGCTGWGSDGPVDDDDAESAQADDLENESDATDDDGDADSSDSDGDSDSTVDNGADDAGDDSSSGDSSAVDSQGGDSDEPADETGSTGEGDSSDSSDSDEDDSSDDSGDDSSDDSNGDGATDGDSGSDVVEDGSAGDSDDTGADAGDGEDTADDDDGSNTDNDTSDSDDSSTDDDPSDGDDGATDGDTGDSDADDGNAGDGTDDGAGDGDDGTDGDDGEGDSGDGDAGDGDDGDDATEPETHTLTVTVTDHNGEPVTGETVHIVTYSGGADVASGTTDENGQVQFELEDGDYEVAVTAPEQDLLQPSDNRLVTIDGEDVDYTVELQPAGGTDELQVTVTNHNDEPIEGTAVSVATANGGDEVASGETDSDGIVTFDIESGEYDISASHDDARGDAVSRVTVDGNTEDTLVLDTSEGLATGVVTVVDQNGNPVDGEPVILSPPGTVDDEGKVTEHTDEDGKVRIELAAGSPEDVVMYGVEVRDQEETLAIMADAYHDVQEVTFEVSENSMHEFTRTIRVVDENGPVEGELVEARNMGVSEFSEVGTTDENGEVTLTASSSDNGDAFMFDVRVAGTTVTGVAVDATDQKAKEIQVGPQEPVTVGDLTIVTEDAETEEPIEGATVTVEHLDSGDSFEIPTNSDGEAVFENVPHGEYAVTVEADGWTTAEETVAFEGDTDDETDLRQTIRLSPDQSDKDEDPVDPADALEVTDIEVLGSDPDEEYIEITNTGDANIDLSGYEVWDQEGGAVENRNQPEGPYVFQDFVLEANSSVQLWTGDGEDDNENVYWGESLQLWAQDGDTVRIYDSDGELVVRYEYESQESLLLWLTQLFF